MSASQTSADRTRVSERAVVLFSLIAEGATGVAALLAPGVVARLLFSLEAGAVGVLYGRLLGVALLALVIACWPRGSAIPRGNVHGLLAYNLLAMGVLAYAGVVLTPTGILLWPAAAVHGVVALLLVRRAFD